MKQSLTTLGQRTRKLHRNGCGFLLVVCFFSCILLMINGMIVSGFAPMIISVCSSFESMTPRWLSGPRIAQIFVFALPVLLVFLEWAIVDWIVDRVSSLERWSHRDKSDPGNGTKKDRQ